MSGKSRGQLKKDRGTAGEGNPPLYIGLAGAL